MEDRTLKQQLTDRFSAWFDEAAKRLNVDPPCDVERFMVRVHSPEWEDDGTLYLSADVEATRHEESCGSTTEKRP
jgi:hypothetical protein